MKTDLRKSVVYQIYPRTLTAQGTIKAATELIVHFSRLGVDILYMSAVNTEDDSFENQSPRQLASGMNNPKNPYRIKDYFSVDEEFGTMDDLKEFVDVAHTYGMKVICDLVYLHCSAHAVFIEDHPDFVLRDENNNVKIGENWPFARLNYNSAELCEYMWSNMEFFIRDIGADGFRCDVGDDIPYDFWEEGINRIKKINPDVIMINEGGKVDYLNIFDVNYNFDFIFTMLRAFACEKNSGKVDTKICMPENRGKLTAVDIRNKLDKIHEAFPKGKLTLGNSENHDTASDLGEERIENFIGSDGMEALLTLHFTIDCLPMIYNGCEVADKSLKSMFWNRFCSGCMSVDWQNLLTKEGKHRYEFLKELIWLHRHNEALGEGSFTWIENDSPESVLSYKRESENESVSVVINISAKTQIVTLDSEIGDNAILSKNVSSSKNKLTMLPYGYIITK